MSPEGSLSLPCRGCTEDCRNRESCQGMPWRAGGDIRAGTLAGQQTVREDQQDDGGADYADVARP